MSQLQEARSNLKQGKGSIYAIVGDAGTGKSRIIEEFRATLNSQDIQWREGHCYAYTQSIPYFPLIDLFNRAWQIKEGDSPETVRKKVESGIKYLLGDDEEVIPYIGTLYSLSYPEIEGVSPELWKTRLHKGVQSILSAPGCVLFGELPDGREQAFTVVRVESDQVLLDGNHPWAGLPLEFTFEVLDIRTATSGECAAGRPFV